MSLAFLSLVAVGLVGGSLGALLGVGGGILIVPGLIFVTGLPFREAVAASLVCIVATSAAGSQVYLRRGQVDLGVAVELQFFTVLGAVAAGLVAALVPAAPLFFVFALLLLIIAAHMWPRRTDGVAERRVTRVRRRLADGASVGAGFMSGLLGVGGGVLNVPILHLLTGMAFDRAVATSVYILGITAAAGAAVYFARGDVHVSIVGPTMLGTMAGAAIAALVGRRLSQRFLKAAFALLLLYIAYRMAGRGLAAL